MLLSNIKHDLHIKVNGLLCGIKTFGIHLYRTIYKFILIKLRDRALQKYNKHRSKTPTLPSKLLEGQHFGLFESARFVAEDGFKRTYSRFLGSSLFFISKPDNIQHGINVFHNLNGSSMSLQIQALMAARKQNQYVLFLESSFLAGIFGYLKKSEIPLRFRTLYSFLFDDLSFYYDSILPSRLEMHLNSDGELSNGQRVMARDCIRTIVKNGLTKYNFLLDDWHEALAFQGRRMVLVVDQRRDDASVLRGRGSDHTFSHMLKVAQKENPDALILVKTHPDSLTMNRASYLSQVTDPEIIRITEPVNPYSLLQLVDEVYVCTSQLGFEALLAGKKVNCFGQPFYAGWGLTLDRIPCVRRTRLRNLEELFMAVYDRFAVHVNPYSLEVCSLPEYLKALVRLRDEFRVYRDSCIKIAA